MAGRLPGLEGVYPTLDDWSDHLTTLFPEVRMKRFLEMRGADGGRWGRIVALSAFWVGLLYDDTALAGAWDLVRDWTESEREQLRRDVPRLAFQAPFRKRTVREVAAEALSLSRIGLRNRKCLNPLAQDERIYLAPLEESVATGKTCADQLLDAYEGRWGGSVDPMFSEFSF